MTKPSKPFRFKQFTIEHDKCAMKVGFDGALLAAWATFNNPINVLDIGAGSGLISLILRQRFQDSNITSIEPNKNAIIQSNINFNNSPFKKEIDLIETKLQDYDTDLKFDLILSNPPFFTEETGGDDEDRNQARQEKYLPINDLLTQVDSLLSNEGKFYLIYPTWEITRVIESASKLNIYISEQTTIYSNKKKPSKRTILEFQKKPCSPVLKDFTSGNQDIGYSNKYKELMKDLYIIF